MNNKIFVLLFLLLPGLAIAAHPSSFSKAKKLSVKIYKDNPVSFYCGCKYESKRKPEKKSKRLTPDWSTCGYTPRKNKNRASRIEWEHVMPAHHFGHQMKCWQKGGRKLCKKNPVFKKMESDLHNLVPAIGEVNGDRSNYKYGMIEGEKRSYGSCDVEVNFKSKRIEARPEIRGDISRIYFYMRDRYGLRLSRQQEKLFKAWATSDPVDSWEIKKNKKVLRIQGNSNPYIQ